MVGYEITAGNTNGQFALNSTNGLLALVGPPVAGTNTLSVRVTDSNNWQTNNTIEVQVWAHGWFTAVNYRTNGQVQLQFVAGPGLAYGVEASTNLVDWELIGVAADHGAGTFEFEDTAAAGFPQRFYRIVSP